MGSANSTIETDIPKDIKETSYHENILKPNNLRELLPNHVHEGNEVIK